MGDVPGSWFGDCQDVAVAGDLPGEVSSLASWLMLRPRGAWVWLGATKAAGCCCVGGALENWAFFLNWGRCFSSERSIPSFVKGLGSTSFIPEVSGLEIAEKIVGQKYSPYRKYMSISSARIFEVMAMMGICGRTSLIQTVADTPSR